MIFSGRQLLQQAVLLREKHHFSKSLMVNEKANIKFLKEKDLDGFCESMANRSITLRVWAELEVEFVHLRSIARAELQATLKLSENFADKSVKILLLYNLAQVEEDSGDLSLANQHYQQAIALFLATPLLSKQRPAQLAQMQVRADACAYQAGQRAVLPHLLQALERLQKLPDSDPFTQQVWLSGAYLRLAKILSTDQADLAQTYLKRAQAIIENNSALLIRQLQLKKFLQEKND